MMTVSRQQNRDIDMTTSCRRGAPAPIARAALPPAIGPSTLTGIKAGERGCYRFSGFTTTAYPLRMLLQPPQPHPNPILCAA
jgi:hypothetical protein